MIRMTVGMRQKGDAPPKAQLRLQKLGRSRRLQRTEDYLKANARPGLGSGPDFARTLAADLADAGEVRDVKWCEAEYTALPFPEEAARGIVPETGRVTWLEIEGWAVDVAFIDRPETAAWVGGFGVFVVLLPSSVFRATHKVRDVSARKLADVAFHALTEPGFN